MARAATSPELALYRTPGTWSRLRCAILTPPIVFRARINQTFTDWDQITSIVFDGGVGTVAHALPDMEVWIGSTLDGHEKGICRLRERDATHFYLSETSEIQFADNDYVTILAGYQLWARPVRITTNGTVYMDEAVYTDQHTAWDPQPNMGSHRVLELTGATVSTTFNASSSFCPGGTIASYLWTCSTASASSGTTTATPTFTFNSTGWHIVYLTVTSGAGKSFWGVRYVYVWSQDDLPPLAEITNPGHCDVDSGGWEMELKLYSAAGLDTIYDRAMVILFSEDHYGSTVQAIGPVAGSENIRFVGWVSGEINQINSEQGAVAFEASGAAYWMGKVPSWPDGVELTTGAASWTSVPGLTVDLGAYHFLRWRSTATRIMDVTLTGDTRTSQEVSSAAQNLWSQLQEMTWAQIYARPGVNAQGQLSIQIHPSLIPVAARTYPTVMTITKVDYADELDFERSILPEVGIVDMSGVAVTSPGVGSAYFALAPGHSLPHYGDWDIQPNLLLSSQAQVITLAALYRSWRNNPYKSIPIVFNAPIGLIDCFPNQRCSMTISPADNVRGLSYSGGLIPIAVELVHDPDTGYLHTEVTFEAETNETGSSSRVGDTPGSGTTDGPVDPSFPPLPPFPPIVPGGIPQPAGTAPSKVLLLDANAGFIYTENFADASPNWYTVNAGLGTAVWGTTPPYQSVHRFFVTPSGALYAARLVAADSGAYASPNSGDYFFVARAPSIGAPFEILIDPTMCETPGTFLSNAIYSIAHNPLVPDTVMFLLHLASLGSPNGKVQIGSGGVFADGAVAAFSSGGGGGCGGGLSYGFGLWLYQQGTKYFHISQDGMSATPTNLSELSFPIFNLEQEPIVRGSTTAIVYCEASDDELIRSANNLTTQTFLTGFNEFVGFACDPTGSLLMARYSSSTGRYKSSDSGATWISMGSLPAGSHYFKWAGGSGVSNSRWIAAGAIVRSSDDFGATWINKEGDIANVAPIPEIKGIWVVEY